MALAIIEAKMTDDEKRLTEVRDHPECPQREDWPCVHMFKYIGHE